MSKEQAGFLGIDIGGTRTKFCITTANNIVHRYVIATEADQGQQASLENIWGCAKSLINQAPIAISAIGIGICGPTNFYSGTLITSPILVGWEEVPLRQLFQKNCSLPVFVDNDANLAIWAETIQGAAKNARNVVGFTVGTGVGGGIVIDGSIHRGSHWYGGELGHMTVNPDGRTCPCGNRGCLTIEASAKSIVERYAKLTGTFEISSKQIFCQAKYGNDLSLQAIQPMLAALSIGIANVLNIFDPDFVVIAGGPTTAGPWLLNLLTKQVQQRTFDGLLARTKIVFAELGEWAGAYGAAALAANLFRP